jgi:hypothetical protein
MRRCRSGRAWRTGGRPRSRPATASKPRARSTRTCHGCTLSPIKSGYTRLLQLLNSHLAEYDDVIAAAAAEHPDALIFASFPGVGQLTTAVLLSEIGQDAAVIRGRRCCRPRPGWLRSPAPWAAHTACASAMPPTLGCASPPRGGPTLDEGITLGRSSVWYARDQRGQRYRRALRGLAAGWMRVLRRCWTDCVPDDPSKHLNTAELSATSRCRCCGPTAATPPSFGCSSTQMKRLKSRWTVRVSSRCGMSLSSKPSELTTRYWASNLTHCAGRWVRREAAHQPDRVGPSRPCGCASGSPRAPAPARPVSRWRSNSSSPPSAAGGWSMRPTWWPLSAPEPNSRTANSSNDPTNQDPDTGNDTPGTVRQAAPRARNPTTPRDLPLSCGAMASGVAGSRRNREA